MPCQVLSSSGESQREQYAKGFGVLERTYPLPMASEQSDAWPLLILDPGRARDAGMFLARCRRCGWKSPRQPTPCAAWAAFDAHVCEERPA